jgi:hypothetical protein
MDKLAYAVDEINDVVPLGRTKAFAEIAAGKLVAHKIGRRTIVMASDLADYLAALPTAGDGDVKTP